jgi:hypothetical protein
MFWDELFRGWEGTATSSDKTPDDRQYAVFARHAPQMKPDLHRLFAAHAADYPTVLQTADNVWQVICTAAAHHLWLRRNDAAFRGVQLPVTALVRSTWRAVECQLQALLARPPGPTE